jgi:hypothetical protein
MFLTISAPYSVQRFDPLSCSAALGTLAILPLSFASQSDSTRFWTAIIMMPLTVEDLVSHVAAIVTDSD